MLFSKVIVPWSPHFSHLYCRVFVVFSGVILIGFIMFLFFNYYAFIVYIFIIARSELYKNRTPRIVRCLSRVRRLFAILCQAIQRFLGFGYFSGDQALTTRSLFRSTRYLRRPRPCFCDNALPATDFAPTG